MIGMQSKPNMLDIHNLRFAAFSPYAFAIPLFFGGQQLLQVRWIYRLWKDQGVSAPERQAALDYAPTFILGNLCIATWLLFWVSSASAELSHAMDQFRLRRIVSRWVSCAKDER